MRLDGRSNKVLVMQLPRSVEDDWFAILLSYLHTINRVHAAVSTLLVSRRVS